MCSRYELNATAREVAARFRLTVPPIMPNRAEIRPTDHALVVMAGDQSALRRWGLPVDWDSRPLINARAETLAVKPAFRKALAQRVLIPASWWWEWRKDGNARHKTCVSPAEGGLLAFAGLAEGEHFTLITCAAAPAVTAVHDRMPVVLTPEGETAWLDPSRPFAELAFALAPYDGPLTVMAKDEGPPSLFPA